MWELGALFALQSLTILSNLVMKMELVFFFKFTENRVPPKSLPFLYFYSSSQSEW